MHRSFYPRGNNVRWVPGPDWMAEYERISALSSPVARVYSDSFVSLSARTKSRTDEVMFVKFDFVTFYDNLFSFRLNNFKKYFL